jgi:hypothetical protein
MLEHPQESGSDNKADARVDDMLIRRNVAKLRPRPVQDPHEVRVDRLKSVENTDPEIDAV